jgi:hypothetical protein
MPVIYDPPPPPPTAPAPPFGSNPYQPLGSNPYVVPEARHYAIEIERFHHVEALYRYGEYAMFVLMWTLRDFEKGRVERCTRCFADADNNALIADVYKQANMSSCPVCFGTSFEGGYRALVVRPSLWVFTEDADRVEKRGVTINATGEVQTTHDIQFHSGDYVLRGDTTRWQVGPITAPHLSEGFETPTSTNNLIANSVRVNKEDPVSSAYQIGPDRDELISILNQYNTQWPVDFTSDEDVRSPLVEPYDR